MLSRCLLTTLLFLTRCSQHSHMARNAKRDQMMSERNYAIECENALLLDKMRRHATPTTWRMDLYSQPMSVPC